MPASFVFQPLPKPSTVSLNRAVSKTHLTKTLGKSQEPFIRLDPESIRGFLRGLGLTEHVLIHEQDYEQFLHEKGIQELGSGGEGSVYFLRGHAVKVVRGASVPSALREIAHMLHLNHKLKATDSGVLGERTRTDFPALLWVYVLSRNKLSIGMKPFDESDTAPPGCTLYDRLQAGPRIERQHVLSIIRGVGRSLLYAHMRGVIHNDLKPANIYIPCNTAQTPVVFDLGQALWQQSSWGRDWLRHDHNKLYWYNGTYRYMHHERRLAHLGAVALAGEKTPGPELMEAMERHLPSFYNDVFAFARIIRDILRSRHTCLMEKDRNGLTEFYQRLMGVWKGREDRPKRPGKRSSTVLAKLSGLFHSVQDAQPEPAQSAEQRWPSMQQAQPELEKVLNALEK